MVDQNNFIIGEWYSCKVNSHLYQFKEIKNNKFIASAWIHLGSFSQSYKNEQREVRLVYFDTNKKANIATVNYYINKNYKIIELW